MAMQFGATLAGVLASFLLWFGGEWLLRWTRNRRVVRKMMSEIVGEMNLNMGILEAGPASLRKVLEEGRIPVHVSPLRMRLGVYESLVSSGDIRLISDIGVQSAIRYAGMQCHMFNEFLDNTERILATLIAQPFALQVARDRIDAISESADAHRRDLATQLASIEGRRTNTENRSVKMAGTSSGSAPEPDTGTGTIAEGIADVKKMLIEASQTSRYQFRTGLMVAMMAVGVGLSMLPSSSKIGDIAVPILGGALSLTSLVGIIWARVEYRPKRYRKRVLVAGSVAMLVGIVLIPVMSMVNVSGAPLAKVVGLGVFAMGLMLTILSGRRGAQDQSLE